MYFDSFSQVLTMDGHGAYVWFCYGLFVVVMGLNIVRAQVVKRRLLRQYQVQQATQKRGQILSE